jgi:hypothetical protein
MASVYASASVTYEAEQVNTVSPVVSDISDKMFPVDCSTRYFVACELSWLGTVAERTTLVSILFYWQISLLMIGWFLAYTYHTVRVFLLGLHSF